MKVLIVACLLITLATAFDRHYAAESLCYAGAGDVTPLPGRCVARALNSEALLDASAGSVREFVGCQLRAYNVPSDSSLVVTLSGNLSVDNTTALTRPYHYRGDISVYKSVYDAFGDLRKPFWTAITEFLSIYDTASRVRLVGVGSAGAVLSLAFLEAMIDDFEDLYRHGDPLFNISLVTFGALAPTSDHSALQEIAAHSCLRFSDSNDLRARSLGQFGVEIEVGNLWGVSNDYLSTLEYTRASESDALPQRVQNGTRPYN